MKLATGFLALAATLLPAYEFAHAGIVDVKRSVEASMVVTGTIEVNPDGSVHGYSLDQQDKVPADVAKLIGETVPNWRFRPILVDGNAVLAKAGMSLRIVAEQESLGQFVATVDSVAFGSKASTGSGTCAPGVCVSYREREELPQYPVRLVQSGVTGTAYISIKIDSQGRVAQAGVRQVNLRAVADPSVLESWRRRMGQAALDAVRTWTFNVPTVGDDAGKPYWAAIVPVDFHIKGREPSGRVEYGQWDSYVPGPVTVMPWVKPNAEGGATDGVSSAIPAGDELFVQDERFVLLTPLAKDSNVPAAPSHSGG
ncbi:MAG: hypothetical protein U1F23_11235 [Lysobacterales bacterium]